MQQAWDRLPQTDDEEAFGVPVEGRRRDTGNARRYAVGLVVLLALVGALLWSTRPSEAGVATLETGDGLGFMLKADAAGTAALDPKQVQEKESKRAKLLIEEDLEALFHKHRARRGTLPFVRITRLSDEEACFKAAGELFDHTAQDTDLKKELEEEESKAFRHRFATAMEVRCKDIKDEEDWAKAAGEEMEHQKPVMTQALVDSLNAAGLGFEAKMHEWLVEESAAMFATHLGTKPTPKGQKSVFGRGPGAEKGEEVELPKSFQAEEKWPECSESILRIHNQGECGSCWAFGGLASVDARLCIASKGTFNGEKDILSRLQVSSCAAEMQNGEGADGCQGGYPHWPMLMMADRGIVSTSCLPYYIGGEGIDHFEQQEESPPCAEETHCQGGYSMTMEADAFWAPGIEVYDWLTEVHGDAAKILRMKLAIFQDGPVSFAFAVRGAFFGYASGVYAVCDQDDQANHAVYASGWGEFNGTTPYIQASNSWGKDWGDNGRFLIHPNCLTDVTIAGSIKSVKTHEVLDVTLNVTRDPSNPIWPWRPDALCPVDENGCVTDMEGEENYTKNEACSSSELNGRKIKVVEFDTEPCCDHLKVNGHKYAGDREKVASMLDGMVVDDHGIRFKSDPSEQGAGFKLCPQ